MATSSSGAPTTKRIGAMTLTLKSDLEIELTRDFDAPRHLVFEVMSKPEHVRRWWGLRKHDDQLPDRFPPRRHVALRHARA
jgi:uncharacterized protein YndB with AHSA1/START domain